MIDPKAAALRGSSFFMTGIQNRGNSIPAQAGIFRPKEIHSHRNDICGSRLVTQNLRLISLDTS